eukprot:1374624-Amorphochlora_amoeboformis.AAC.3
MKRPRDNQQDASSSRERGNQNPVPPPASLVASMFDDDAELEDQLLDLEFPDPEAQLGSKGRSVDGSYRNVGGKGAPKEPVAKGNRNP